MPLAEFISTAFGRQVQGMGPVEPSQINGLGFMLSDKTPGLTVTPHLAHVSLGYVSPTA